AELGAEQLEGVLVQRRGGRGHLAEVEEHRHQRGRVGVDLVAEVAERCALADPHDRGAVAAGDDHATDRGCLHLLELATLRPLALALLATPATATEGALGAATTAAVATATARTATARP